MQYKKKAQFKKSVWDRVRQKIFNAGKARGRVYIIPTFHGICLLLATPIIFILAIFYKNDTLYIYGFSLLTVFFLAMIQTHGNLRSVQAKIIPVADPFSNQQFIVSIVLQNIVKRGASILKIRIIAPTHARGMLARSDQKICNYLAALESQRFTLSMQAGLRGPVDPFRIVLSTRYPYGLFYAWKVFAAETQTYVIPEPQSFLPLPESFRNGQATGAQMQPKGSLEFLGVRPLQWGDSSRRILWRRFRPGQTPEVRILEDKSNSDKFIHWNQTSRWEDDETRLSQICAWILVCQKNSIQVQLCLPHFELKLCREIDFEQALRALATYPHRIIDLKVSS